MLNKINTKLLTHYFVLLFLFGFTTKVQAQNVAIDEAIQLFSGGDYKSAILILKELLENEPENPKLNFYYGASRTEIGFFSEKDLNHLLKAKNGEVPVKINYYIGKQFQAQNNWSEALKYYNRYRLNSSEEDQNRLNLTEKIQQCYNKENPYSLSEFADASGELDTFPTSQSSITDSQEIITEDSPATESITKTTGEPIEFRVNSEITYLNTSHFKTEKGKNLFLEANSLQEELDFSLNQMEKLRDEYRSTMVLSEKQQIGEKILSFENETYRLKEQITRLRLQAGNAENEYWQNATQQEIVKFNMLVHEIKAKRKEDSASTNKTENKIDTSLTIDSDLLLGSAETTPIVAEPQNKDELIYKIQIGAYSRGLPTYVERLFKKLSLIRKIENYTDDNGVVVYTTGNLKNLEDAIKMQNQVRQEGVEDAFVVPYFNGKRITLEQAKKIEADL